MENGRRFFEARGQLVVECKVGLWEWAQFDVWRRYSDDRLFLYVDGGCSCDGPYDSHHVWEDLQPISSLSAFKREMESSEVFGSADEKIGAYSLVASLLSPSGRVS